MPGGPSTHHLSPYRSSTWIQIGSGHRSNSKMRADSLAAGQGSACAAPSTALKPTPERTRRQWPRRRARHWAPGRGSQLSPRLRRTATAEGAASTTAEAGRPRRRPRGHLGGSSARDLSRHSPGGSGGVGPGISGGIKSGTIRRSATGRSH
jgi:hypothetical protein